MDNVYSPPRADLERAEQAGAGRRLPRGWGPVEVLQACWELLQRDMGPWLGVAVITFAISFGINLISQFGSLLLGGLSGAAEIDPAIIGVLSGILVFGSSIVGWVVQIYLYVGQVRMALASTRGQPVTLGTLFSGWDILPAALGASILVALGTLIGFVLLIIPGIIFVWGVTLYLYAMVDRNLGAVESVQESWRITDGYKGTIFVTFLVMGLALLLVTCLTCGLGFLAMTPVYALALGLIYQTLAYPSEDGT